MRWRSCRIVAFDTETTGLNPEEGHRVIEFAGIELRLDADGNVAKVVPFHRLFNPGVPIPREATEVSGLRDEDVADKPPFEKEAAAVRELLAGAVAVAHNFPFDQRFLTAEFARAGLRWPATVAEIDTVDLSRRFFPEARGHKLGELAQRMEVSLEGAHRATNDAEACGRCFVAMTRRFGAPDEVEGLVDWGDAIGPPPETGHLARDEHGAVVFLDGPHAGKPVEAHTDTLAWMCVARTRGERGWELRYPEGVRRWAERWLRVRASGRASQAMKGYGPGDWGIDTPLGAP
ncbi:MAG: PolC-type DNA polymerase III [Myxococcota bacterium]